MAGALLLMAAVLTPLLLVVFAGERKPNPDGYDHLLSDALEAHHPHEPIVAKPHSGAPLGRPVR